jgi:hypothetical protein
LVNKLAGVPAYEEPSDEAGKKTCPRPKPTN